MVKGLRILKGLGAAALCALLAPGPPVAQAQSVQSLQERIQMLEQQLHTLKEQLQAIQKEQEAQKAKADKQAKSLEPLGALKELKKTVEALSKVEVTGGVTGTVQSTSGVGKQLGEDESFAVGVFDVFLTHRPMDNVKVVLNLKGVGGDGPDSKFRTFSRLNEHVGSTNDNVIIREAYLEAALFNERLTLTAGKIDSTNYIDTNAFANNEHSQFLGHVFVNNAILTAPDAGPGIRARLQILPDLLYLEGAAMNQDRDANNRTTDKFFEDVHGLAEIGLTPKFFDRQGNYRLWGFADGAARAFTSGGVSRRYTAYGAGVSFDQEITEWLGAFFRLGYRDPANLNYDTQWAWSAGLQLSKIIPERKDDVIGFAYGQVRPVKRAVGFRPVDEEDLYEFYYRWAFTEKFHLSFVAQYLTNRLGNRVDEDFWVFGARLRVNF